MASEINELEAIRKAVAEVATKVNGLIVSGRKTRVQLLSLEAVVATLLARTTGTTPQSAFELIRQQADSVSHDPKADEELATSQVLLKAIQTQILGKA